MNEEKNKEKNEEKNKEKNEEKNKEKNEEKIEKNEEKGEEETVQGSGQNFIKPFVYVFQSACFVKETNIALVNKYTDIFEVQLIHFMFFLIFV